MILRRLYELAVRENLLDDLAFEEQPVPFIINLAEDGKYLGIEVRRGTITVPGKKNAPPKTRPDKGNEVLIPRPHGNTATQGFARFFVDTLPRVLPVNDEEKSVRSRISFWKQIDRVAGETKDRALVAVQSFGNALHKDADLVAKVRADVLKSEAGTNDRFTFAYDPDQGLTILARDNLRKWYQQFFQTINDQRQDDGPRGVCQVTGQVSPIPKTHPMRLSGIPGGLPTGASITSYDKAAFESYGLEGTANASVGCAAADGYLRALTALIQNKIRGAPRTSLRIGDLLFLYWTRTPADTGFMALFENADSSQIERLLASARQGKESHGLGDANDFYLLGLSGNSARAIVRDYLEAPLPRIKDNLAQWFRDLRIADSTKDGMGQPTATFPLWQLALATAMEMERVSPDTPPRLLSAALKGDPLPESLLAACLGRLRAEGSSGFRPARMALIKITLLRRNVPVTETLDLEERHPAYLYGRLLTVFEQIQYAALGDVNANVVDKFYGTFSAAPALVFSRLYANAQNHLRKIRSEKPGSFVALDKLLTEITRLLPATPPRGHLRLQDQGRFALGYYHQRAKRFEDIAARKLQGKLDAPSEPAS